MSALHGRLPEVSTPSSERPRFSVAIPNYNYADYLDATITSVLDQTCGDVEIHVSDNASTDRSRQVIARYADKGVRLSVNRANVGFAGNLDRAVSPTRGRFVLLLSSDDLMLPTALATYARLMDSVEDPDRVVVAASHHVIDANGRTYGRVGPQPRMWSDDDFDHDMSDLLGVRVLRVAGPELLRRSILAMRNPLPFLATAYPRHLYDELEGYGGSRNINPDKWFHWRLASVARAAYFVDLELFAYRTHASNQASQQRRQGALKHLVDEYTSTFDVPDEMLATAQLGRADLVNAFLRNDIIERAALELLRGDHLQARRMTTFGTATFPRETRQLWRMWLLRAITATGPIGGSIAKTIGKFVMARRHDDGLLIATGGS